MKISLKFCMITTFYPPYNFGGDGIFVYRLSNELAQHGHYVDIIHCIDSYHILNPAAPTGNFPNHPNIKVHGLKSSMGFLSPLLTHQTGYPFLKGKKIKRVLDENGFDIIHFHNISLMGGPGMLQDKKSIKLYTTHEYWLICPLSVLWKFKKEACTKPNCFFCTIHAGKPPQLWRYSNMLKKMLANIDAFISPSQFTIKKHHKMGLKIPFIHIPNFLPSSPDKEISGEHKDIAPTSSRPYFLYVGRLEKIKGLQTLIRVFQHFNKSSLFIAGHGCYGETLRKLAGGAKHIKFLGQKNFQELKALYQNALAVIVPSLCYEVFGLIILEAFAVKTPVIVNNNGALPELVQQSGGGFVFNNDLELLKAMNTFLTDPALRKKLGEKGYYAFKKYWTEKSHLEKYFNLINEIAEKKRADVHHVEYLTG